MDDRNGRLDEADEALIREIAHSPLEWDDRTSPADYPDHMLLTVDELAELLRWFAGARAEMLLDGRRYRWLRDRDPGPAEHTPPGIFIGQVPENLILSREDADAAIDAAMARGAS